MINIKVTEKKHKLNTKSVNVDAGFLSICSQDVLIKAVKNEFGDSHQPERSFIRSAIDENRRQIEETAKVVYMEYMTRKISHQEAVKMIGQFVVSIILSKIDTASSWATPLSEITIKKKGHDIPLIYTGDMYANVSYGKSK